jgi:hypothetical protein
MKPIRSILRRNLSQEEGSRALVVRIEGLGELEARHALEVTDILLTSRDGLEWMTEILLISGTKKFMERSSIVSNTSLGFWCENASGCLGVYRK